MTNLLRRPTATTLLARLIDDPALVERVRVLPPSAFSALVRRVGVEDAGEVVALATAEQLVAAFDEDLFRNERPGEREGFDRERFATWLEVLLEAGPAAAAARIAELSEDFVVLALSSLVLVLDNEALLERLGQGGSDARAADKAIERSLSEEIDGYLLVSRDERGWDAVLELVSALDRDHRELLERVLDRCATLASHLVDDLDELAETLDDEASLADDVEGEREDRRGKAGYVEPRAARSFLLMARRDDERAQEPRDPVTRMHFRYLAPEAREEPALRASDGAPEWLALLEADGVDAPAELVEPDAGELGEGVELAMRRLAEVDPGAASERMVELAYLANVLVAGAEVEGERLSAERAARAALATVSHGLALEVASGADPLEVLRRRSADWLFRRASRALVALDPEHLGFIA